MSLDSQSAHAAQLSPLEAMRARLRAGFKIFPVFGLRFENGKLVCACGNPTCASPCKHPATAHGLKDATADFDTFVALCNGRRGLNVGVATDGYVAVDVDPGKGGAVAWAKVSTELQLDAAIDGTPQARSGGGGSHVIWRAPEWRAGSQWGLRPRPRRRYSRNWRLPGCASEPPY
jgi:Bifunctional DNA primase/polymerase, N-terminal